MLGRKIAGAFGLSLVLCAQALAQSAPSNDELFQMLKAQQRELAEQQKTIRNLRNELQRSRQPANVDQGRAQNSGGSPSSARGTAEVPPASAMAANIPTKAQPWTGLPLQSSAGIVGGVEFVYMRTHFTEDFLTTSNQGGQFNPSYRYWLGVESSTGLGARLRYWSIDGRDNFSPTSYHSVKYSTFDAEITQRFSFSQGHLLLAAGYRHARGANEINGNESKIRGDGITVAIEGATNVLSADWLQATGSARWSAIYGRSEDVTNGVLTNTDRTDLAQIVELRVGGQVNHRFTNGGKVTFGAGGEAQYWSNGAFDDTQDLGFIGFYLNGAYKHPF